MTIFMKSGKGKKGNRMVDGIIFDVDGTLWDSTNIVSEAWADYLKNVEHLDIDVSPERLGGLFGKLLPDIAAILLPELSSEEQLRIMDRCCKAEEEALRKKCAPLYPRLEETLAVLSEKYPLFIVSNCQAGYIEVFLEATGFSGYFTDHLCPGDTGKGKAENIRRIIEKHQLKDAVYVGDTLGDYQACQEAGVPFIFASYGFGEVSDPYAVIQTPADLRKLLL